MKIYGAFILTALGLYIGQLQSANLWRRHRALIELKSAIELLYCEIEARNKLVDSLCKVGSLHTGVVREFFLSLATLLKKEPQLGIVSAWDDCACVLETLMSPSELGAFSSLATILYSGEEPRLGFLHCIESLDKICDRAEDSARRDGKMYTGLGVSIGIMLAVILV